MIQKIAVENNSYSINICKKALVSIIIKMHKDTIDNKKKGYIYICRERSQIYKQTI
jgi:hypothetical protein